MPITILPRDVAEKIAAGEVIERPFSVVKELVDNALDADASRITIEILNRGLSLIRVTDDGKGMTRDELALSIVRHATSKITTMDDLDTLSTMGFRGEALPSIGCIASLEMCSRKADEPFGTRLITKGGAAPVIETAGAPYGTQVVVHDLFYNVPARKKFLRSAATEHAAICEIVETLALAFPQVAFTLTIDGKERLSLAQATNRGERIRALFGKDMSEKIIPISIGNDCIKLSGFISQPDAWEHKRTKHFVFINNRPITSRVVIGAVNEAYKEFLVKDRFPIVFLFLEMSGTLFDVNVHPRKIEVKFLNEPGLFSFLRQGLTTTLSQYKHATSPASSSTFNSQLSSNQRLNEPETSYNTPLFHHGQHTDHPSATVMHNLSNLYTPSRANDTAEEKQNIPTDAAPTQQATIVSFIEHDTTREPDIMALAWLANKFILAHNTRNDLIVIDQHAAHERILYEQFKKRLASHEHIESQGLLIPTVIELPAHTAEVLRSHLETLTRFGFFIEESGKNIFSTHALPSMIVPGKEKALLFSLVEKLANEDTPSLTGEMEDTIIKLACSYAYKANQKLSLEEMKQLIADLMRCDNPYHCPHGRPTVITIPSSELDKRFARR